MDITKSGTKLFFIDRYNNTTGTFKVPPGGDGFYYFSIYLLVQYDAYCIFDIEINGEVFCTAYVEQQDTFSDTGPATCSTVANVTQGISVFHQTTLEF